MGDKLVKLGARTAAAPTQVVLASAALLCMLVFAAPAPARAGAVELFDEYVFPPLTHLSSLNKSSEMLAVQTGPEGTAPVRVIAVDKTGKFRTIQEFDPDMELTVPAAKLWIAGEGAPPDPMSAFSVAAEGPAPAKAAKMPVKRVRVYLSASGETYTVVYMGPGSYYELRHHDSKGGLLFVASPMDGYGLKTVHVSDDGERVIVVDESRPGQTGPPFGDVPGRTGQRLYFYDRRGKLLADHDMGPDQDTWLDASGGLIGKDGGYFAATRGRGAKPGYSIALFGGDGKVKWEKSFYGSHRLLEDFGGLFRVKGGSGSLISLVDRDGGLMVLERAGYGFELWINPDRTRAYLILFREFDADRAGLADRVKALFPGCRVGVVDLVGLMPRRAKRPGVVFSPGGEEFIHYSLTEDRGKPVSTLSCYDAGLKKLWGGQFGHAGVIPSFVDGPRGFVLKFGYPITRLVYYGLEGIE